MNKKKLLIGLVAVILLVVLLLLLVLNVFKKEHEYFCDKFLLTADEKQIDLKEVEPELSSVSELLPIDDDHLFIMGRIDDKENSLLIYEFSTESIVFNSRGTTMCWTNDDFKSCRYLKEDIIYDLEGKEIYKAKENEHIFMIEYVESFFKITLSDKNYENLTELWL